MTADTSGPPARTHPGWGFLLEGAGFGPAFFLLLRRHVISKRPEQRLQGSSLNDNLTFARYASTCPFASSCISSSPISATRRPWRDLEACSTALAAAFSQDSLLLPISKITS